MKRVGIFLLVVNVIGAATYLFLASRGWRDPTDDLPITGEPYVWAASLPVLALFVTVDAGWGILIAWRKLSGWPLFGLSAALWTSAIAIDFAHH